MTDKNFLISGTAINSSAQGAFKLPTRKFYNAVYFNNNNQYHHETANHYRDFKLRRHIRQRKKIFNFYYGRKFKELKDLTHEYQQELPMAVQTLPSFENVYATRGRQTLCEQRRPDIIYNDTIKRIQSSKQNIEVLKKLAKKQVDKSKQQQNQANKWSYDVKRNDFQTANILNINQFKQKRQQHISGKLQSVEHFPLNSTGGVIRSFSIKRQHLNGATSHDCTCEHIGAGTLKFYLQLATDYYQQGFLQNIRYLENLAERNQLKRKRQLQLQQLQPQKVHTCSDSSKTTANILTLKSNSFETDSITDATLNSCHTKHTQINQNNPILCRKRQQINKLTVNHLSHNNDKNRNCAIRVNIKPQTANTSHQEYFLGLNKEIYGKKKNISESKEFNSMNDYLNGNLVYTQVQQQQQVQQPLYHNSGVNNHNHNCNAKVLQLDNLIDNLKELDIQENRTNLPRITLTDYCQKYPNELNSDCLIQYSSAEENKRRLNSYLIKQSSLDCSNLDIPLETHYQSEARPP